MYHQILLAVWSALHPYIGEIIAALIIALAAKLHLDWSKHKAKIQAILDAIIDEIANVENEEKTKAPEIPLLTGSQKKDRVVQNICTNFLDEDQPWWSSKKRSMIVKIFGSIPAAVEKAFTLWSAAKGMKMLIK